LRVVDRALLRRLRGSVEHADGDVVLPHVDDADLLILDAVGRRLRDRRADVGGRDVCRHTLRRRRLPPGLERDEGCEQHGDRSGHLSSPQSRILYGP
jgi:hypothetical protein